MASFRKEIDLGTVGSYSGTLGIQGVIRSMFLVSMVDINGFGLEGVPVVNTIVDDLKFENQTIIENYESGMVEKNNWFDECYGVHESVRVNARYTYRDESKKHPLKLVLIYDDPRYPDTFTSDTDTNEALEIALGRKPLAGKLNKKR